MSEWFSSFGQSMGPFGQLVIALAFLTSVFGFVFGFVGALKRQPRLTEAALYAVYLFCGLLSTASLLLVYSFFTHDFSIIYVRQYSSATQPTLYLITAFWGGQAGSLLFWALILSIYGAASFSANRERLRAILPHSITFFMGIGIFFTAMLMIKANPFEMQRLGEIPTDGAGLNPLLQTPLMTVHPPSLYLGYIGFSIPFAFAMGALWAGKLDADWIRATRKATLVSFTFLSVGNILGSWWAYEEIGWGGFWAWDPVETAGFFPWLTGTAFLHSVMIQERRGMFRVWNVFLIAATFFLTILGTMLTRSGLVESVHAFASSKVGIWFGTFLLLIFLSSLFLILYRWKELRQNRDAQFHVLSREFSFLAQNVVLTLMAVALVVFVLTPMFTKEIWPWIQETFLGRSGDAIVRSEASMGPRFYNTYMAPLALALMFLMGVGPLIAWRKATAKNLIDSFLIPVILSAVAGIACFLLGVRDWFPLTVFIMAAFVTATVVQEFIQGTKIRVRTKKEGVFTALLTLVLKGKRRYGGYVVHLGIVAVFLGIAGAFYQGQRNYANIPILPRAPEYRNMAYDFDRDWKGPSFVYGDYEFHYYDFRLEETENTEEYRTYVAIKKNGKPFGELTPGRNWYRTHPDQPSSEIDVQWGLFTDLYMSVGGFDLNSGEAVFTVTINPLVFWLWLGMFLILGGCGICLMPELRFVRVKSLAAATAMLVGLGLFLFAPAAMADQVEDHTGHAHADGESTLPEEYPPVVQAAANRLRCYCPCPHTLNQCTHSECGFGPKAKDEMVRLHQEKGFDEETLVNWYLQNFSEQGKRNGKSTLLLTTPGEGLGKTLTYVIWGSVLAGVAILGLFALSLRRRKALAHAGGPSENSSLPPKYELSQEDERRLQEELARLE